MTPTTSGEVSRLFNSATAIFSRPYRASYKLSFLFACMSGFRESVSERYLFHSTLRITSYADCSALSFSHLLLASDCRETSRTIPVPDIDLGRLAVPCNDVDLTVPSRLVSVENTKLFDQLKFDFRILFVQNSHIVHPFCCSK